jgi:hypothetical protein
MFTVLWHHVSWNEQPTFRRNMMPIRLAFLEQPLFSYVLAITETATTDPEQRT